MMNINIYGTKEEAGIAAGNMIAGAITENAGCVLGLATGSTPLPAYRHLIELYEEGTLDFSGVKTFNLDEYVGIDFQNKNSYHSFMRENLFGKINILPGNINFLEGDSEDPEGECERYEDAIAECGGIDLQLLGLGSNGHIAFNEPGEAFEDRCHIVDLSENTRKDNARFFKDEDEVPYKALTMGIGTIMGAKKILIIATGKSKAEAVKKMVLGEITPALPASILRFHPNTTLMLDSAAASLLTE